MITLAHTVHVPGADETKWSQIVTVLRLTNKPITGVATHIRWDHIGGHKYFPDFYAHADELEWLNGKFPLSIETIQEMVVERCVLAVGKSKCCILPDILRGTYVFGKKPGDIYLRVIWFIRIFCLLIIRLPIRRHILIL